MYCTKCGRKIADDSNECLFCNVKEIRWGESEQNSEYGNNPYGQNPYGSNEEHKNDYGKTPHSNLNKNYQYKSMSSERNIEKTKSVNQHNNNQHKKQYHKNDDWWSRDYDYDGGRIEHHNENEYYEYEDSYGKYRFLKLIIALGVLFIPDGWIVAIVGGIILAVLKIKAFLKFGLLLAISSFFISVLFFNSPYSWYFYKDSQTIFNMILSLTETISNLVSGNL